MEIVSPGYLLMHFLDLKLCKACEYIIYQILSPLEKLKMFTKLLKKQYKNLPFSL